MKKVALIALVFCLCASSLAAATKVIGSFDSKSETFTKGSIYVTPQVGGNTWSFAFAGSGEYALLKNVGIGASILAYFWSGASVIAPTVDGYYHFTWLKVPKLDVFAGLALGFAIYKSTLALPGESGLYAAPFTGARYWFSKKMSAFVRVNFGLVGDYWNRPTALAGVSFKLK